jgi:hypothetical protein
MKQLLSATPLLKGIFIEKSEGFEHNKKDSQTIGGTS